MGDASRGTRVAYVKFMKKKFAAEEGIEIKDEKPDEVKDSKTAATLTSTFARATLKKIEVYALKYNIYQKHV